jgi:hypothetical protein
MTEFFVRILSKLVGLRCKASHQGQEFRQLIYRALTGGNEVAKSQSVSGEGLAIVSHIDTLTDGFKIYIGLLHYIINHLEDEMMLKPNN